MPKQCAKGYAGHLCATCVPAYYLTSDYECSSCPRITASAFLGLASFLLNVGLIMGTVLATMTADYTQTSTEAETSDKLKVHVMRQHVSPTTLCVSTHPADSHRARPVSCPYCPVESGLAIHHYPFQEPPWLTYWRNRRVRIFASLPLQQFE